MPKYCQVPNCNKENDGEAIYYQFPKDAQLKQKWLTMIGRPTYKPTSTSLVCSKHFEETDFTYRFGKKTLRPGVSPSIFHHDTTISEGVQVQAPSILNDTRINEGVQKAPSILNVTRINQGVQKTQAKEKSQKATRNKYSFYIPHYVLVNKEFLSSGGSLNLENLSSHNLSPPILYGIGNTSTVINSPDVVTSPFLKRKKKEDDNQGGEANAQESEVDSQSKSSAIKELAEIHSYTKKPVDSMESESTLDNEEDVEDEEGKEEDDEVQEGESSSNVSQNSRLRYRLVNFSDCSLETLKNPTTATAAWNVIQRTLDSQQKKIKSLHSEHASLQSQLQQLEKNIKEVTQSET